MTREVKNGKVALKSGQCGRMDHHVWQVVSGSLLIGSNTVREKVFGGINYYSAGGALSSKLPHAAPAVGQWDRHTDRRSTVS